MAVEQGLITSRNLVSIDRLPNGAIRLETDGLCPEHPFLGVTDIPSSRECEIVTAYTMAAKKIAANRFTKTPM